VLRRLIFRYLIIALILFLALLAMMTRQNTKPDLPIPPQQAPQSFPNLEKAKKINFEDIEFPEEFFFGTASSDFQTTGGNGRTDWDAYIQECIRSGRCREKSETPFVGPGNGTDFLNRYTEDFDLAEGITQVHRLSLEWARIEPEKGKFNSEAIKRYKKIFRYMRAKGIEPMICLNHFALPNWFAELGGWESPQAAFYYSRYAEFTAANIGLPLNIKWWLTFNEPQLVASIPYAKGGWPPQKGIKDLGDKEGTKRFLLVISHIFDAHRLAYRVIHKTMDPKLKPMVGFASAPGSFSPNDPDSKLDQTAYNIYNTLYTMSGDYLMGTVDKDFIGLNYYGHSPLKLHISTGHVLPWLSEEKPFSIEWIKPNPAGSRPKYVKPSALRDLIMQFKDLGLPIIITENGLNDGTDRFREEFIVVHLKAIHDAIKEGANVIGYQYWALADTWEWDGFFSQMGLIKIDRENNLSRSLRPSALTYKEIIKTKKIRKELLERYSELLLKK